MGICLCIALAAICALAFQNHLLKQSAREIRIQLQEKLSADTNTLIGISSRDADLRALADTLNEQLRLLREEHIRYTQGDAELKTAVANISHDLRTPLTAICGYLDFLAEEEKSEQAEAYLRIIAERTEALRQLTDELLKYSSAVSGKEQLALTEVSLGSVLEESILGYQAALQEHGITPEIRITEKKVVRAANRAALSRIFANLLNNALKYSDGDLTVILRENGEIIFRNHAAALDSLQVARMFDRFYTVECGGESSGLGLSIARALAEQMHGTIRAELLDGVLEITMQL